MKVGPSRPQTWQEVFSGSIQTFQSTLWKNYMLFIYVLKCCKQNSNWLCSIPSIPKPPLISVHSFTMSEYISSSCTSMQCCHIFIYLFIFRDEWRGHQNKPLLVITLCTKHIFYSHFLPHGFCFIFEMVPLLSAHIYLQNRTKYLKLYTFKTKLNPELKSALRTNTHTHPLHNTINKYLRMVSL